MSSKGRMAALALAGWLALAPAARAAEGPVVQPDDQGRTVAMVIACAGRITIVLNPAGLFLWTFACFEAARLLET